MELIWNYFEREYGVSVDRCHGKDNVCHNGELPGCWERRTWHCAAPDNGRADLIFVLILGADSDPSHPDWPL